MVGIAITAASRQRTRQLLGANRDAGRRDRLPAKDRVVTGVALAI
jgi:hypothetical protein